MKHELKVNDVITFTTCNYVKDIESVKLTKRVIKSIEKNEDGRWNVWLDDNTYRLITMADDQLMMCMRSKRGIFTWFYVIHVNDKSIR